MKSERSSFIVKIPSIVMMRNISASIFVVRNNKRIIHIPITIIRCFPVMVCGNVFSLISKIIIKVKPIKMIAAPTFKLIFVGLNRKTIPIITKKIPMLPER